MIQKSTLAGAPPSALGSLIQIRCCSIDEIILSLFVIVWFQTDSQTNSWMSWTILRLLNFVPSWDQHYLEMFKMFMVEESWGVGCHKDRNIKCQNYFLEFLTLVIKLGIDFQKWGWIPTSLEGKVRNCLLVLGMNSDHS